MIQANEIKIDNLFLGYDDKVIKWNLGLFSLLNDGIQIDEIIKEPIPINKEWLVIFGFEISKEGWFGYAEKNKVKFDISSLSEEIVLQSYNGKRVAVKFIHQLQNLYFSLTGEELTLSVT